MDYVPAHHIELRLAADKGQLRHSIYGHHDWREDIGPQFRRCTVSVRSLVRKGLIELGERQRGDEHHGQLYRLTDAGKAAVAAATSEED